MNIPDLHQLVDETVRLTGADRPELLEENSPVLSDSVVAESDNDQMYLVGLIGGKNVGKSSLVNALVGYQITAQTAHGPGTEIVVAYAHQSQTAELSALLDREVPGKYAIVPHSISSLSRQVLLDLPDVDSHFAFHLEITRRMLRHMLFPIWIQSVEKYADHKPRELLAGVAAGNAPANFIFCLNKVDQLAAGNGASAVDELRNDYAARIARTLSLDLPPRILMISAIQPAGYDLPELRELLARQKTTEAVSRSRLLATRQHAGSVLSWLNRQRLGERLDGLVRLQQEAEEEIIGRIGSPLIERVIPRMMDDPLLRMSLTDEVMQQRVRRWPIVNILHVLLQPITSMLRYRLSLEQQQAFQGPDVLVGRYLHVEGRSCAALLGATFGRLQQTNPQISRLYKDRKLWEERSADKAVEELQRSLAQTIERQRLAVCTRHAAGGGPAGWLFRMVITLGAIIWFPIAQPILEAYLSPSGVADFALLVVQVLGVSYLLKNLAFMALYFVFLWMILKWHSRSRVDRWLEGFKTANNLDPSLSLTGQVLEWIDRCLRPIRQTRQQMEALLRRADQLQDALRSDPGGIPDEQANTIVT